MPPKVLPFHDNEWCVLNSRNEQIVFLYGFAKSKRSISLPAAIVGRVFGIHKAHVWKTRWKTQKTARSGQRPFVFSSEQESMILAFIERRDRDGNIVTQRDLLNFVEFQFGKCLTYGREHCFLAWNASCTCQFTVLPQEQTLFHVSHSFLDQYLTLMKERRPLVPGELIFNINECGFRNWEERKPKPVLIPRKVENATLHYPPDRRIQH
jgi:hypothetical protein